jgi:hypothetical protein
MQKEKRRSDESGMIILSGLDGRFGRVGQPAEVQELLMEGACE